MLIKKIAHLLISSIVLVSSLFTACKKSSDTIAADSFAKAMVVHADVNAPAIDFFIDGAKINKDSIVYGAYTPYTDVKITPNTKTQFKIGLTKLGTFLYSDSTTLFHLYLLLAKKVRIPSQLILLLKQWLFTPM